MSQEPAPIPDEIINGAIGKDILANIESSYDEKNPIEPMVYFCKDCRKLVEKPRSISKKNNLTFRCPECKERSVVWGTKRSIYSFFHLNEEGEASEKKDKEKRTKVAELKEAREERLREKKEVKK